MKTVKKYVKCALSLTGADHNMVMKLSKQINGPITFQFVLRFHIPGANVIKLFVRTLQVFLISYSVCAWQAFPA
jgi:hypothetical protein